MKNGFSIDLSAFDKNDWDHLHDCILHVTGNKSTKDELITIFKEMDVDMQLDVLKFGMNDTCWRDEFIEWFTEIVKTDEKCPDCSAALINLWSGVKCSKCDYWFCFLISFK